MRIFTLLLGVWLLLNPFQTSLAARPPDAATFFNTIERGDLDTAREWLDNGLSPDFEGSVIGTGLMIAAWEGNIPMMELFLTRGATLDKVNRFGEQALLHAAWKGHLPAVRWLVERGAKLDREGKQWAALHYAAFAGNEAIVGYLLERGADVNALSTNGSTPLMMAAREGRETIARTLLKSGARRDIVNDWGDNALQWAIRNNNLKVARHIAEAADLPRIAAAPPPIRPQRSQPIPDRADRLLDQARKLEADGQREAALKAYREALAAIRQAEESRTKSAAAPARAVTGLTITARRSDPNAQTAGLNYARPATTQLSPTAKVGAGETAAAAAAAEDAVDALFQRARTLESAGRRAEALQLYRQAAEALRRQAR